ncbi:unnamed protein product [Boreogadus saida]
MLMATDDEKKRCLERSPSSGSERQAVQEAGVDKAAAACSAPRHLKHARCPSTGAREAGQESLFNGPGHCSETDTTVVEKLRL